MTDKKIEELCINTIRFLSVDAVEAANSGHPGQPMEAAAMGYKLFTQILKHNPEIFLMIEFFLVFLLICSADQLTSFSEMIALLRTGNQTYL